MHFIFGLSLHRTTNLRSATVCFGRGQKCFSVPEKEMKVRRASFHFLDHDIQKTVKGTRFCMEASSHKNEIQSHPETEPDSLLVKNVHESFTDKRKTNKNVTLQKYCYFVSHKNEIQYHIETDPDSLLV